MSEEINLTNKKSFVLYHDTSEVLLEMTDEDAGKIIKDLVFYSIKSTNQNPRKAKKPTGLSGLLQFVAHPFKAHIDRDLESWKQKATRNQENGKKGGRPKKGAKKKPKKAVNGTVNVNGTVKDKVKVNNKTLPLECFEFVEFWKTLMPADFNISKSDENNYAKVYDQLTRIDGYSKDFIYDLCKKVRSDEFWKDQFLTPIKLRRTDKDGVKYIERFKAKFGITGNRQNLTDDEIKIQKIMNQYGWSRSEARNAVMQQKATA